MNQREETKCPCGKPAVAKAWEWPLYLCAQHHVDWLRSEEKRRCTRGRESGQPGGGLGDPGDAASDNDVRYAVEDFVNRIAPRGFWARVKRSFRSWAAILRGQP